VSTDLHDVFSLLQTGESFVRATVRATALLWPVAPPRSAAPVVSWAAPLIGGDDPMPHDTVTSTPAVARVPQRARAHAPWPGR
jgi:hypothetical protein